MLRKMFKGKNNDEMSGSTATLFVSTSNLAESRGTRLLQQESIVRKENKAIVHELLANFDMEATKKKHRESRVVEFSWDSGDFSFDSALSTAKVRARLQHLMGTDVIRLNDKNYVEEMLAKLEAEREIEERKKEQALADAEEERIRKLQLGGKMAKNKSEKQLINKRMTNKDRKALHERTKKEDKRDKEENENQGVMTQVEIVQKSSVNTEREHCHGTPDTAKGTRRKSLIRETTINNNEKQEQEGVQPKTLQVAEEERTRKNAGSKHTSKFARKETPFIKELRETETVDGLYTIAEMLMAPVKTMNT